MKKIAFLFLVLGNPNFPKIWNKYFRGHKDKYTIYIHPKYPDKLTWHKKDMIKNLHATEWGFITRAYLELMAEAYKDPDNYKFITISESCVPIQSFDNFYEAATTDTRSWIKKMSIKGWEWAARIDTQKTRPRPKFFIKNYARFCLNREHVGLLLSKQKELEFFHKMHVGDEYFLSVLHPLKNVRDFAVIYDDWDYIEKLKKEIREKISKIPANRKNEINSLWKEFDAVAKSPKTIVDVQDDLEKIKLCKSFFYRKFSVDSNIEKYWKDIIVSHNDD